MPSPSSTSPAARAAAATTKRKAKRKAKPKVTKTCKVVVKKVGGRRKKVKVCKPAAKRTATPSAKAGGPKPVLFSPGAPTPVVAGPNPPAAAPAPGPAPAPVPVVVSQTLSEAHVERLLWRAGFGPLPGKVKALAGQDLGTVVRSLTRPVGAANLVGPTPNDHGAPLQPRDQWGHDHCAWLDRMVRSDQPLVERMTLIWHDWFATSREGVDQGLLIDQVDMFRSKALGSFDDLFSAVTFDPAMLVWLNGTQNNRWNPNENYAREMMELFSLGADRGAYSETDVREMARVLTGWRNDWSSTAGSYNFRYDPTHHDNGVKTLWAGSGFPPRSGAFVPADAVRLCVEHPLHASFFCTKLWSYFVPTAPDDATLASLMTTYTVNGRQIRPVVEAILQHPDCLDGPSMTIPPVVLNAGLLRAIGRGVDVGDWSWLASFAGQRLYLPPNVSGWDDTRWLDTSTMRGRWLVASAVLRRDTISPWPSDGSAPYDPTETAEAAIAKALAYLGTPTLTAETLQGLATFATTTVPASLPSWSRSPYRAMRQNALRALIANAPETHVC